MPKVTSIGTPGEANKAISGTPTLYYFDFASKGRGEVLRLFFEESGIAFKDHRWSFDEVNKDMTEEERAQVNPVGSLPYLDLNGKILTQSYSILRYFAAKLQKYDGENIEEKYFVDRLCDLAIDWRTKFVDSAFVTSKDGLNANEDKKPFEHHKNFNLKKFVKGIEGQLAASPYKDGPFTLGSRLTYADLVIFQIYHDEREIGGKVEELLASDAKHLKALVDGVAKRPNIAKYFASERYYN